MSVRHHRRRARHKALKADCVVLLDRIAALYGEDFSPFASHLSGEIAEMRMRLAPPPGIKAPIIRTGYTKGKL
jgi:hypothetical protein